MSSSEAIHSLISRAKRHGVGIAKNRVAMKSYEGRRSHDQTVVTVDGKSLDPRFDLWPFDFNGFEWGYESSGAMQLSLALLADHLKDDKQAASLCQAFARAIVSKLPCDSWKLSATQIQDALLSETTV